MKSEKAQPSQPRRSLFNEIVEGIRALSEERKGKLTLRRHVVNDKDVPPITPRELVELREHLRLSRPVFASYLRTNSRTLENWEQGRAKPNAQATLLILMVKKFPDTIKRLKML